MAKKLRSPNWDKHKNLPFLERGFHNGYPFSEGFPESPDGEFEIVTAWGERVKNVRVQPATAHDHAKWDTSRSKLGKLTKIFRNRKLDEAAVAGWLQTH